jgi:hypothetical protein
MAKQKKRSVEQETALADKRRRNRASRIRVKLKDGKLVTDEERAFLAEYDAEPHGLTKDAGDPAGDAPESEGDQGDEGDELPELPGEGGDAPPRESFRAPPPPGDPLPPLAALPTPPKAAEFRAGDAAGPGRVAKWQERYGAGSNKVAGREQTCVYIGSLYHGVLKQMSDSLREADIDPIIDVNADSFHNAIVLAVDDLLPAEIVLTPTIVAVGGGSALTIQRFVKSKAIKDAQEKKKLGASASRPVQEVAAARAEAPPPPPPPKPEPTPPPPEVRAGEVTEAPPEVRLPGNGAPVAGKRFDRGGIY